MEEQLPVAQKMSARTDTVICSDVGALSMDAAFRFTALSAAATKQSGKFAVALAGGHTPEALYGLLAAAPFRDAIDWSCVHLFFGDERAVPSDSPFSNFRMASETLIKPIGLPAGNVHRIFADQGEPASAAAAYEADLAAFFPDRPFPSFDLVLLGMGPDGHCASLFPRSAALLERRRSVVAAEPGLQPFVPRITLTLPAINSACNVLFLVTGQDKAETIARVFTGSAVAEDLPVRHVKPENGTLTWLLDRAAAGKI